MFKTWIMFLLMMVIGPLVRAGEAPASSTSISVLRAQMEVERGKEQELQLLQLEVDRLKLEVEKRKAVVELGKMDGSGRGAGLPAASGGPSFVSLRYVFMAPGRKEAVLDVDGIEHRVQEGEGVGDQTVKAISVEGVSLQAKDGLESFLTSL